MDYNQFLSESVFYPCSGLDEAPMKLLLKKGFRSFVYADYYITRKQFRAKCLEWIPGYRPAEIRFKKPLSVLGETWDSIRQQHHEKIEKCHLGWSDPFIALVRFVRIGSAGEESGPSDFFLLFLRCEAITTYLSLYTRKGIGPKCITYIRSGIGFGGNYSDFPQEFEQAIRGNRSRLPQFMLYDRMATFGGDEMPLVKRYSPPIEGWDLNTEYGLSHLTFAGNRNVNRDLQFVTINRNN